MGITIFPDDIMNYLKINNLKELKYNYENIDHLINLTIELSDNMMYKSKKISGNFYSFYDSQINDLLIIKKNFIKVPENLKIQLDFQIIRNEN